MAVSITAEEARHVATLPKNKGKRQLLQYLGWQVVDEETHLRESIHLDILYDHLMFCTEKGFPWSQITQVLTVANTLVTETKGLKLVEAVKFYQKISESLLQSVGGRNYKIYTDFVFSTFMTHFKLFQYVFTTPRVEQIPKVQTDVVIPPEPESLENGKLADVWEYDQKYQQIEELEKQKAEIWQRQQQKVAEQAAEMKSKAVRNVETFEGPLDKEAVGRIIKEILGASVSATTEALKTSIGQTMEELEYKLDRTILPRPQTMGPPPRFNPKNPVPVQEVIPPVTAAPPPSKPEKSRAKSRESTRSIKSGKSGKA